MATNSWWHRLREAAANADPPGERPLAIMAASAVLRNGEPLRQGGYGLLLTNRRIKTTTPLGPKFSLPLGDIETVSDLQQGRFALVTRDGVRWEFVVRTHGHSGYRSVKVALHYDGDATPFVLALQNLTKG